MSRLPKTAGISLTEKQLRTYNKCSQLYAFDGEIQLPNIVGIAEYVFERMTTQTIRKNIDDPLYLLQQLVTRAIYHFKFNQTLLDQQVDELSRRSIIYLNDLFDIFTIGPYIPIYGPIEQRLRISKTPIDLRVSGIFRSAKNKTVHCVQFTPYTNTHSVINDPLTQLKINIFSRVVEPHPKRKENVCIHTFGARGHDIFYTSVNDEDYNRKYIKMIKQQIKSIEDGYHMPIIPCPYACAFKTKCTPQGNFK